MLSDVDVHFLVGLLMTVHAEDDVTIELGEAVYDEASDSRRDVDITVRSRCGGGHAIRFTGLEVKNHARTLDSTHVEQLSCKLNDMPEFTSRCIVSASGFTKPAIAKAAHHGIETYNLQPFTGDVVLNDISIAGNAILKFDEDQWEWTPTGDVRFVATQTLTEEEISLFTPDLCIVDSVGNVPLQGKTLRQYLRMLLGQSPQNLFKDQTQHIRFGETEVRLHINLQDRPSVILNGRRIHIEQAHIAAVVRRARVARPATARILRNLRTNETYGFCAVAEYSSRHLLGLMLGRKDRSIRLIAVPEIDRKLKKVTHRRLA